MHARVQACARVSSVSVKTKRQFSEYFIPLHCFLSAPHHNADHWNMHTQTHTHRRTCSVSRRSCRLRGSRLHRFLAGATTVQTHLPSGSEAVLYTCQPSSEPGYKPWTQAAAVLRESPGMLHQTCFQQENQWFRVNRGYLLGAFAFREVTICEC